MAWTAPRTWVTGELATAALLNSALRDNLTILKLIANNSGRLQFADATELTIASGVITVTQNYHKVDTQSDSGSDDLDTITAGTNVGAGFLLTLRVESDARTVVIKAGTGGADNIDIGDDVTLDESYKTYSLVYDGSKWRPWTYVASVASESDIGIVEGRLTATSGLPVTTADVSGTANVYFAPYGGSRISLYDGSSAWEVKTFTQITISLSGLTASKPYDVFAYNSSGTVTIETLVWTNTTTRATALATQDGVLVKTGATTRRYLGTVYINASGGQTDDTILKRYIWNYYNRVSRTLRVMDTTASWTYTTATVRQMRGSTANQVETVIGVAEVPVSLSLRIGAQNTLAAKNMWAGIGHNATTAPVATSQSSYSTSPVSYYVQMLGAGLTVYPAIGFSYFSMLEWSVASGTTTFYGNNTASTPMRTGMSGWIEG